MIKTVHYNTIDRTLHQESVVSALFNKQNQHTLLICLEKKWIMINVYAELLSILKLEIIANNLPAPNQYTFHRPDDVN